MEGVTVEVQNWGDAVFASLTAALQNFLGFLPQLVGALIILVIGWFVAGLLAGLVERALKVVGFERAAQSTGIAGFIQRSGSGWTASRIVAEIVKWFIRLIALQAAASVLGMPQVTEIINSILLFLPNLVVALVIVVIGALIANFVAGIVRGATGEMGFGNADLLASIARYAILVFAVIAAVNQVGIAATVVNTLFIGAVAAIAAAFALAFGLGGREVAAQITQGWYAQGREASEKVGQYAERQRLGQEPAQKSRRAPRRVAPKAAAEPPSGAG